MNVTKSIAEYIRAYRINSLDEELIDRTKLHITDSFLAMTSGSALRAGRMAAAYVSRRGAKGECTVVGAGLRVGPESAALANGMCAHADETDDISVLSRVHPGASIVPAALAMAQEYDRSGEDMLRAVAVGYDVGITTACAAYDSTEALHHAVRVPHAIGGTFGAAAASALLAPVELEQIEHILALASQEVAGIGTLYRDQHHVEKALGLGGLQARAGVETTEMVIAGFTGVAHVFDEAPSVFDALGSGGRSGYIAEQLGTHHIFTTDIKRYPVGGPILAPAEALFKITTEHQFRVDQVKSVQVRIPSFGGRVVRAAALMPDVNLQYALSLILFDRELTFAAIHDETRRYSQDITHLMSRIEVVTDSSLDSPETGRPSDRHTQRAHVTVHTTVGDFHTFVDAPLGSRANPFRWDDMRDKAEMVLAAHPKGTDYVAELLEVGRSLDTLRSARELDRYLR